MELQIGIIQFYRFEVLGLINGSIFGGNNFLTLYVNSSIAKGYYCLKS